MANCRYRHGVETIGNMETIEDVAGKPQTKPKDTMKRGIFLMCLSAFLFAAMQIAIRKTVEVPIMEQVFFRNIVSLFISFCIIKKQKGSYFGGRKYQPLLMTRSSFGFIGLISMFYASGHAHQADVTILFKLSPFLITLFAFLFLKETIQKVQIPALLIAFAGAAFVANPVFQSDMLPLFAALLCAGVSAVSYTLLAYFKDKVDGMTIIFHFSFFCVMCSLPFLLKGTFIIPSVHAFLLLLLIGVLGGFGQIALTYAYRMAPAAEISIYNYSGIIFAMILAYVFLGEGLKWNSLVGASLVIFASLLIYFKGGKSQIHSDHTV